MLCYSMGRRFVGRSTTNTRRGIVLITSRTETRSPWSPAVPSSSSTVFSGEKRPARRSHCKVTCYRRPLAIAIVRFILSTPGHLFVDSTTPRYFVAGHSALWPHPVVTGVPQERSNRGPEAIMGQKQRRPAAMPAVLRSIPLPETRTKGGVDYGESFGGGPRSATQQLLAQMRTRLLLFPPLPPTRPRPSPTRCVVAAHAAASPTCVQRCPRTLIRPFPCPAPNPSARAAACRQPVGRCHHSVGVPVAGEGGGRGPALGKERREARKSGGEHARLVRHETRAAGWSQKRGGWVGGVRGRNGDGGDPTRSGLGWQTTADKTVWPDVTCPYRRSRAPPDRESHGFF
jgi:hypothetical protein